MYNIIKTRYIWFVLSGIVMVASIVFISLGGLKFGIDFTGGSLLLLRFQEQPDSAKIQEALDPLALGEIRIQPAGSNSIMLKLKNIDNETKNKITEALSANFSSVEEESFESIGPTIGKELQSKAITSIIIVLIAIIAYIAWAFRKVSSGPAPSWVYGLCAIIALFHDILIVTGIFAMLGYFYNIEVDSLFITALLTILGFSVHDTIVVFDRIRENIKLGGSNSFIEIINTSINQTMIRSLNTSQTTFLVLLVLFLFGGASLKYFILALLIGIIIGTYSSIFVASPLLLVYKKIKNR